MPNGDTDTVRVQLPNGQTGTIPKSSLPKAQRKGWKVVDTPFVAGAKTAGREAALGAFGGLGIAETTHPLQDTWKAMTAGEGFSGDSIASAIIGPAYQTAKGLAGSTAEIAEGLGADPEHPSRFGPVDIGKAAHGGGSLATQVLSLLLGVKGAKGKPEIAPSGKNIVRGAFGAGEGDVRIKTDKLLEEHQQALEQHQEKVEKIQKDAAEKVQKVKETTAEKIADVQKRRVEASAKEAAAKTKQEALTSKHGPVYKRINEMADDAQQHVQQLEGKVNETEAKKWEAFNDKLQNPAVSTEPVADAIEDVKKHVLTGDNVTVFNQFMHEIFKAEAGEEYIDTELGLKPKANDMPLNRARQFYTKMSRKLHSMDLPSEVGRATGQVLDALDSSIAEGVTKKGGPKALAEYRKLQSDWRKYRETFSDKDSPLRKIIEAKDPNTKLGPITGETGSRAVDYLGRYGKLDAETRKPGTSSAVEKLGRIRALDKKLTELPGGGGSMPEKVSGVKLPGEPELPKEPAKPSTAPADVRKDILKQKATAFSQPLSKWEMMNPKLLLFRKVLKGLIQNPKFVDWLSK